MKPSSPDELLAHDAEHALVLSNLRPRVWWLDLRHLPTGETRILVFTSKAKAKGETTLKREKGAGKATKAKAAEKHSVEKLLQLADALADVALDLTLDRGEVVACAEAYNIARGR